MNRWKEISAQRLLWVFLSLLVISCVAVAAIAGTVFYRSNYSTDLTIDLIPQNGYSYEQVFTLDQTTSTGRVQTMSAAADYIIFPQQMSNEYSIADEYGVIWTTDTKVDIFKTSYENQQQQVTVAGEAGSKVIAPGTENDYTFTLRNNGDGIMDYKMTMNAFFTGLESGKVIPVEARVKAMNGWLLGDPDLWNPVLDLRTVEDSAVLEPRQSAVYTLEWRWPFESGQDELDTWLGNQQEAVTLTIEINTQTAYHNPIVPAVGKPVPAYLNGKDHIAYIYGYPDGTVRPDANITRAEVAAIFYRLTVDKVRDEYYTTNCDYPDVPANAWYRAEVATMTNMTILEGYPDGTFRPDDPITRGELATILARFAQQKRAKDSETIFTDIEGHWAENFIKIIEEYNWIIGYEDGTFRPDNHITRAETVTMVNRMLHRMPETLGDLLEQMHIWPDNADPEAWYFIAIQEASHSHTYKRMLGTREKWVKILEYPYSNQVN